MTQSDYLLRWTDLARCTSSVLLPALQTFANAYEFKYMQCQILLILNLSSAPKRRSVENDLLSELKRAIGWSSSNYMSSSNRVDAEEQQWSSRPIPQTNEETTLWLSLTWRIFYLARTVRKEHSNCSGVLLCCFNAFSMCLERRSKNQLQQAS